MRKELQYAHWFNGILCWWQGYCSIIHIILHQNAWGSVVIYCVEKLSDSVHFGGAEESTMRRNRGNFLWQMRMEITICFVAALLLSGFTSAEQRERVVMTGMSMVWPWFMPIELCKSWLKFEHLQLHWWVVINCCTFIDKLVVLLVILQSKSSWCF